MTHTDSRGDAALRDRIEAAPLATTHSPSPDSPSPDTGVTDSDVTGSDVTASRERNDHPSPVWSLAVIGGGPRAIGFLERLAENLTELWPSDRRLSVHVIDPYPIGPGRIWRYNQSPLLKLNSRTVDVTMFTDETSTIAGPVRPGPSLIEWAEAVRAGEIDVVVPDAALRAEIKHITGESFPTRRLQSLYLSWFATRTFELLRAAGPLVSVSGYQDRVVAVDTVTSGDSEQRDAAGDDWSSVGHLVGGQGDGRSEAGRQLITLANGQRITADVVLYSLGHTGADPEPEHAELIDFAARKELFYLPPAFTADADTRPIVPGQRVIVRGFGLAAVDLTVLLTEGRGGRYQRDPSGILRYLPSGLEPRLILGSRRGVPYHSKISSTLVGEAPEPRYFTRALATALEASRETLDLSTDVWPLIAKDALLGYYRELFTGHPERVSTSWDVFFEAFDPLDPVAIVQASGREPLASASTGPDTAGLSADSAAFVRLVTESVNESIDVLFLPEFDRPLAGFRAGSYEELQAEIRAYIQRDLDLRTNQEHSATLGLFIALLTSLFALSDIIDSPKWTAKSRVRDIHGWWFGYFSYIASGPPGHRLEELIALSEAGIIEFLGGELWVEADENEGIFRAGSANTDRVVTASALVDARLPETNISRSDNAALLSLLNTGEGSEELVADADFIGSTGRLVVHQNDTRIVDPAGQRSERRYAIGPYTNSPFVGAFSRPKTNAISFRENDKVARAVLQHLGELAAAALAVTVPDPAAPGSPTPGSESTTVEAAA